MENFERQLNKCVREFWQKLYGTIFRLVFIDMDKEQHTRGRWNSAVKKRKLNYRFHNPNPEAETADYLLKILIEANTEKVQAAIQEAATEPEDTEEKMKEEHPA